MITIESQIFNGLPSEKSRFIESICPIIESIESKSSSAENIKSLELSNLTAVDKTKTWIDWIDSIGVHIYKNVVIFG